MILSKPRTFTIMPSRMPSLSCWRLSPAACDGGASDGPAVAAEGVGGSAGVASVCVAVG